MKLLITAATLMLATFAVALLSPAVAGAQYDRGPTLVVSPPNPSPGDTITIEVERCEPYGAEVEVRIDGVPVGEATLDETGGFTGEFVVPDEARGEVMVEVLCDNGVLASVINVQIGDLPFVDDGNSPNLNPNPNLPRTGSNTGPLVQAGVALLGAGAIFWAMGARRRDQHYMPQHAETGASHG